MKFIWICIFLSFFFLSSIEAQSADWSFYGSARLHIFYRDFDKGDAGLDDEDVFLDDRGSSRIGAYFMENDKYIGQFEYGSAGPPMPNPRDGNAANLRLLWGGMHFKYFRFYIGRFYSAVNAFISSQAFNEDGLLNSGGIYSGRNDGLAVVVGDPGTSRISINLLTPDTSSKGTGGEIHTTLPKLEASCYYYINRENFFKFMLGYNGYEIESSDGQNAVDIRAHIIGILGVHNFKAFYFGWNAFWAQNYGDYMMYFLRGQYAISSSVVNNWHVEDARSFGGLLVIGYTSHERLYWEIGSGFVSHENDAIGEKPDDTWATYIQSRIKIADGFTVTPEIGFYDLMDNFAGYDSGYMYYAGAKWQMNF